MKLDRRLLDLFGIDKPILLAPMAGSADVDLAIAVARAGGLGAIPCALITPEQAEAQAQFFRGQIDAPLNLNFFCHTPAAPDAARDERWRERLAPYAQEYGVALSADPPRGGREPFSDAYCQMVERVRPKVVSFHFGLPADDLLARVKAAGALVISSATNVEEARWLEDRGCDAIIAQGAEAGGHRGMFLTEDVSAQIGTMALVPLIVDAVRVPVIAAGAIADGRGIAAAFCLGAAGAQIGTALLKCPEAKLGALHRAALERGGETTLTNVMTGRPARGLYNRLMREVGPLSVDAPAFPDQAAALAPLKAAAEARGADDFTNLWSGQAAALSKVEPAAEKLQRIWNEAEALLQSR